MMVDPQLGDAIARFQDLLELAKRSNLQEPAAVTLATADRAGRPAARIVLLRGVDERGFVFFTNSHSRKGREFAENPQAALCFYWDHLAQQVRVEGTVEIVSDDESDAYWARRSRESQIGAWASLQSSELPDLTTLEARVADFTRQFAGISVPRPEHWFGYRVVPDRIEFWVSRPARLHERFVYHKENGVWVTKLLYP